MSTASINWFGKPVRSASPDELSANGRDRIPTTSTDPNPFVGVSLPNLKKEIFASGFRNCHRLNWEPIANVIVENNIGLNSWEEVTSAAWAALIFGSRKVAITKSTSSAKATVRSGK
jgi:hypothetical protein